MLKKLALLCAIPLSYSSFASDMTPTKSGMYDVGGFKLYLECYQNDKPTLILEQGFGRSGSDGVWLKNIEQLKSHFSICLYDRAGLGKSEKGKVPFTINDNAERLHNLLTKADIKPPYYFAGGSYASYIVKAYNNLYPKEVLGAVFIDPPTFGYFHTMATRWPEVLDTDNEELKRYAKFEKGVSNPMVKGVPENIDHLKSYQQLLSADNFAGKPVIVIRSKPKEQRYDPPFVPNEIALKMDELVQGSEQYFNSLSSDVEIVYSTSPRHALHIADPDLVVSKIKAILQ